VWYDRHRRVLPWRAKPGETADPYRVWLSEIMLQQTTVRAVVPYYARFLSRWATVRALAEAPLDDILKMWAGLGYYARARNLHTCARAVVEQHDGFFPDHIDALQKLPGIGRYTASAIAAIAFGREVMPVDGNIERVVTRLFAIEQPLPQSKADIQHHATMLLSADRPGDFAQAMMDLGATICTPKNPACGICPFMTSCAARIRGDAETFPRKPEKTEGRLRRGAAFWAARADGAVLVRTRPPKGLLGGMTEIPTTVWAHDFDEDQALMHAPEFSSRVKIAWRRVPGVVTHVFTHFPLELVVFAAKLKANGAPPRGMRWVPRDELDGEALPNVMRKVVALASGEGKTRPGAKKRGRQGR
jgi:A/G-specific adenine glycosylase